MIFLRSFVRFVVSLFSAAPASARLAVIGLRDIRVVDFSTEIAGPYCTKFFADAGADVVKVEPPAGDPLRRWTATGAALDGADGALFRFLNAGKRSIVGAPGDSAVLDLVSGADLLVEDFRPGTLDVAALRGRHPSLVVLSITPFGQTGPYAHRPWTEFTLQAEAGSVALRGLPDQEPYQAGGRITEWVSGAFGAAGALAAVLRARRGGHGEHVDLAMLDAMNLAATTFMDLIYRLLGIAAPAWPARSTETPSIEPSADGWVGFNTNSAQQFADFLVLIERPDLQESDLTNMVVRMARHTEWEGIVRSWTRRHSTAEIVERASALRIPVAPVLNGRTVLDHEHFRARGVFVDDASGEFKQPRRPYRIDGAAPPAPRPAPRLGEHSGRIEARDVSRPKPAGDAPLPFAGLRVVDMTNWWAGPSATHLLACLGADVIHIESTARPDGARFTGGLVRGQIDNWWECSVFFLAAEANKRSLTLELSDARARSLLERLLAESDLLVENYSPRVLDGFGLGWERLQAIQPRLCLVRMPAFGLDGPWRDHVGFAQTMEQISGLAWVTGHADDQPRIQRGPCDPLAGMTAAFATMVALAERDATGKGVHVECPMVEAALNAAAEAVIEYSAYGSVIDRLGNRAPGAAPQGIYPCRGHRFEDERWLALSVATDEQWQALKGVLGNPHWAKAAALAAHAGRHAAHNEIDAHLRIFFAGRDLDPVLADLLAAGVPAAPVVDPRSTSTHPQMAARRFYEEVDHPIAGSHPIPALPFRFTSVERWTRSPAPTLGQNNRDILCGLLGLAEEEYRRLDADGIIGTRPAGL